MSKKEKEAAKEALQDLHDYVESDGDPKTRLEACKTLRKVQQFMINLRQEKSQWRQRAEDAEAQLPALRDAVRDAEVERSALQMEVSRLGDKLRAAVARNKLLPQKTQEDVEMISGMTMLSRSALKCGKAFIDHKLRPRGLRRDKEVTHWEDVLDSGCACGNPDCEGHNGEWVSGTLRCICHPEAGLIMSVNRVHGVIGVKCNECGKAFGALAIASRNIDKFTLSAFLLCETLQARAVARLKGQRHATEDESE